jgi:hypothetical protein
MKRITASALIIAALSFGFVTSDALAQNGAAVGSKVGAAAPAPVNLTLPNKDGSVRFLVIGDTGTGTAQQQELAGVMMQYHAAFPYEFVLLLGDNMYGAEKAVDFKKKFEERFEVTAAAPMATMSFCSGVPPGTVPSSPSSFMTMREPARTLDCSVTRSAWARPARWVVRSRL